MAARKQQLAHEVDLIARASLHHIHPSEAASRAIRFNRFLLHYWLSIPDRPHMPLPQQQRAACALQAASQVQHPSPPSPLPPSAMGSNKRRRDTIEDNDPRQSAVGRRQSIDDEDITDSALDILNTPELVGLDQFINLDELLEGPGGDDSVAPLPPSHGCAREFEEDVELGHDQLADTISDDDTPSCLSPVQSPATGPDSPTPEDTPRTASFPPSTSLLRTTAVRPTSPVSPNLTILDILRGSHG